MMSRYKEVADIVFKYRDHRDRLVRRSITALLPRIAHFLRDRFVTSYLKVLLLHIMFIFLFGYIRFSYWCYECTRFAWIICWLS